MLIILLIHLPLLHHQHPHHHPTTKQQQGEEERDYFLKSTTEQNQWEKANEEDKKKLDAIAKENENIPSKVAYSEAEWNNTAASGEFEKKYNERLKKKKEESVTVTYEGGATTKETHPILDENGKVIGHSWTKTTGGGVKTTTVNKNK